MKQIKTPLSIGYAQPGEGQFSFSDIVRRYREDIGEVYYELENYLNSEYVDDFLDMELEDED